MTDGAKSTGAQADVRRAVRHLLAVMRLPEAADRLEWRVTPHPSSAVRVRYDLDLPEGRFRVSDRTNDTNTAAIFDDAGVMLGQVDGSTAGNDDIAQLIECLDAAMPALAVARRARILRDIEGL